MTINTALVAAIRTKVATTHIFPGNTQDDAYRYIVLNTVINIAVEWTHDDSAHTPDGYTLNEWSDRFEINLVRVTSALKPDEIVVVGNFFLFE